MNRFIATFITCIVSVIAMTSCSKQDSNPLTTIPLAEVTRSVFYAPFYVAINEGFFEEEGIEIKLTTTPGGDKTMTTLLSGGADIILVGSETSIYVANQDAKDKVINFAVLTQTDGTFLVAREDITDFNWNMLIDSTFIGQRIGGMPQMVGESVLKQKGIDPQEDLELVQNIDFANIASAFASGTGDFVQLFEPSASVFEEEGVGYVVASFGVESGSVPYTTFMARESYMTEQPDVITAFTRAIYRAQQWTDSATPEEVAASIISFFPDTSLELLASSVRRYQEQDSFAINPLLDELMWDQLQDIMMSANHIEEPASYQDLVDTSFATQIMNEE